MDLKNVNYLSSLPCSVLEPHFISFLDCVKRGKIKKRSLTAAVVSAFIHFCNKMIPMLVKWENY